MNPTPATLTQSAVTALLVDTEPYLSCDECFERMDEYVEGRLTNPLHEHIGMETHLKGCGVCAEEAETMEELLRQDALGTGGTATT